MYAIRVLSFVRTSAVRHILYRLYTAPHGSSLYLYGFLVAYAIRYAFYYNIRGLSVNVNKRRIR